MFLNFFKLQNDYFPLICKLYCSLIADTAFEMFKIEIRMTMIRYHQLKNKTFLGNGKSICQIANITVIDTTNELGQTVSF